MVFCKPIQEIHQINPQLIYAIVADGAVRIKYIRLESNEEGYYDQMVLVSENYLEHPPIHVDIHPDLRIYELVYKLTDLRNSLIDQD